MIRVSPQDSYVFHEHYLACRQSMHTFQVPYFWREGGHAMMQACSSMLFRPCLLCECSSPRVHLHMKWDATPKLCAASTASCQAIQWIVAGATISGLLGIAMGWS
eukprot:1134189-Pelagomonas_calceolata.AAC.5